MFKNNGTAMVKKKMPQYFFHMGNIHKIHGITMVVLFIFLLVKMSVLYINFIQFFSVMLMIVFICLFVCVCVCVPLWV